MTFTRSNGYASLSSYSLLADGRAGALVAADGADGGAIGLAPTVDYQTTQRFIEDTMALETTFRTAGSFALDAMARLGLSEEVHAALYWIFHAVERTAPELRSLYTLDGRPASAGMTSSTKGAFTFYAGSDELDAAVLLAARTGFRTADDPRLASTIEAIHTELDAKGPLLYRYSGMAQHEGAFLACTFWLIEALTHAGDTGLYSEEADPGSGELRGSLPQALTHLALIGAATALAATQCGSREG